ncbi:MAG: hypothetical protein WAS21_28295 [Geminicoccaceae bacterium]
MTQTPKRRRTAGKAATRRWRERRAQGRRLITIEVANTTLLHLAAYGLLSITDVDDSVTVAAVLSRMIASAELFAGAVRDHTLEQTRVAQGIEARGAITKNAGAASPNDGQLNKQSHLQRQGRNARGRWVAGVSGNPAGKKPGTRNRGSAEDQLMRLVLNALSQRG